MASYVKSGYGHNITLYFLGAEQKEKEQKEHSKTKRKNGWCDAPRLGEQFTQTKSPLKACHKIILWVVIVIINIKIIKDNTLWGVTYAVINSSMFLHTINVQNMFWPILVYVIIIIDTYLIRLDYLI